LEDDGPAYLADSARREHADHRHPERAERCGTMDLLPRIATGIQPRGWRHTASFRMFTGQLAANGHCKLVEIERAFGVTAISVKRSVKQYRNGGCRAFFQKRRPRGPGVLTAEKVSALQGLLDEGVAYPEAARQQGIKVDTVRKGIGRGLLRTPKKK